MTSVSLWLLNSSVSRNRTIFPEASKRFLEVLYDSVQRYYDEGLSDFEMRDKVVADLKEFSDWSGLDV